MTENLPGIRKSGVLLMQVSILARIYWFCTEQKKRGGEKKEEKKNLRKRRTSSN